MWSLCISYDQRNSNGRILRKLLTIFHSLIYTGRVFFGLYIQKLLCSKIDKLWCTDSYLKCECCPCQVRVWRLLAEFCVWTEIKFNLSLSSFIIARVINIGGHKPLLLLQPQPQATVESIFCGLIFLCMYMPYSFSSLMKIKCEWFSIPYFCIHFVVRTLENVDFLFFIRDVEVLLTESTPSSHTPTHYAMDCVD